MAKKKPQPPAAAPDPVDPLHALADEYGVAASDVVIVAELWKRHFRYEHVDADALLTYADACNRLHRDGEHVAPAVVERVKAHLKAEGAK